MSWHALLLTALAVLASLLVLSRMIKPVYSKMNARAWRQVWSYILALIFVILWCLLTDASNQR
jgi:hypothetical protein